MNTVKYLVEYEPGEYKQVIEIANKFELQYYLADLIKRYFINVSGKVYRKTPTIKEVITESFYCLNTILYKVSDVFNINPDHLDYIYECFGIRITRADDMYPEYDDYKINHVMEELPNKVFVSVTPKVYHELLNKESKESRYKLLTIENLKRPMTRWYITKDSGNKYNLKYTESINGSDGYLVHFNIDTNDIYFKTYKDK